MAYRTKPRFMAAGGVDHLPIDQAGHCLVDIPLLRAQVVPIGGTALDDLYRHCAAGFPGPALIAVQKRREDLNGVVHGQITSW